MAKRTFTGTGDTFEQAFDAAAEAAFAARTKPPSPDEGFIVRVEAMSAIYGTIVGHTGLRQVEVSLDGQSDHMGPAGAAASTSAGRLVLRLDVYPDKVTANLMPPVRRPQPHTIGLVLTVTNIGGSPYSGQSPDSGVARFSVLRGRHVIWTWPEITNPVVTPVTIQPGQSLTYAARWPLPDAVELVGADLTAVARFVPSGDSAMHRIVVDAVH